MQTTQACQAKALRTPDLAPQRTLHVYFSSSDMLATSRRTLQLPWQKLRVGRRHAHDSMGAKPHIALARCRYFRQSPAKDYNKSACATKPRPAQEHDTYQAPGTGVANILPSFAGALCQQRQASANEQTYHVQSQTWHGNVREQKSAYACFCSKLISDRSASDAHWPSSMKQSAQGRLPPHTAAKPE